MQRQRILKLRALIAERVPQDIVVLEEVEHRYVNRLQPFRRYVSTTTHLKVISNPIWAEWRVNRVCEFLQNHIWDPGLETQKEYLKRAKQYPEDLFKVAGERGTKIHAYADRYFKKWIAEDKRPEDILQFVQGEKDYTIWSALRSLQAWVIKSGYVPLASELRLWRDFECKDRKCDHSDTGTCDNFKGNAGTCDGIGVIGNRIVAIDLKSSNQLREDYELQIADYAEMFWSFTRIRLKYGVVVKLDKEHGQEDDFDLIPNLRRRFKTYMYASLLYSDMQEIRKERKAIKSQTIVIK